MARNTTPTFTHEIRLFTNTYQRRKLKIKFRALRELYNTVLGEIFKRFEGMLKDSRYQEACKLYRLDKTNKTSIQLFKDLEKDYELSKYHLQKFATHVKNTTYMADHLDAHTVQVISDRAFDAYIKWKIGKRGKPRFKSWKMGLRSIQGKTNACVTMNKQGKIKWGNLILSCDYDKVDKHGVQAHALNAKLKYCRIVHRIVKGKSQFYVQLVCEGTPLIKANHKVGTHKMVGIDIGPSTIAAVSKDKAILTPLCQDLQDNQDKIKRLQRKMSRSQRANNEDNFEANTYIKKDKHFHKKLGKVKKGKKEWKHSKTYQKDLLQLKELHRKQRDKRQYLHNCLANEILSLGNHLNIETNNFRAWQKGWFGKSISFRAPSNFISTLSRKALNTGGKVESIEPWKAKLSQYCHVCQGYHKKPLSQRTHTCEGKPIAQRDLYSAALALYYNNTTQTVDASQFQANWTDLDAVLKNAVSTLMKTQVSGQFVPESLIPKKIEKRASIQMSLRIPEQTECRNISNQNSVMDKNPRP
jgi:hypothetical protein